MKLKKKLSGLYVIADAEAFGENRGDLCDAVAAAIEGGACVIQFRDKKSTDEQMIPTARRLLQVTRRLGVPLIINDRLSVAKRVEADGVHLGQEDGSLEEAKEMLGEDIIFGRSTHSPEQALKAQEEGFDYLAVGPIFSTPTKPGTAPVGLKLVRFAADRIHIPFVAIGGIDESNAASVRRSGAKTIAVVRAVIASEDPRKAAQAILASFEGRP